ncbi:MAG: DUF917 domain-containing protein [Oscillospiraceae bacterium]
MKILSKQDLHDILYGCTILGTGGGGTIESGLSRVEAALAAGKEFKLCSMDEMKDDDWLCVPYFCGALTYGDGEDPLARLKKMDEPAPLLAFEAMEEYLGVRFEGVLSTALGGGNTAEAFYVAAMKDRVIVDADPAGRSVPELQHSTFFVYDIPITPMAVADAYGDTAILPKAADDFRAEDWVRALAVASNNSVGVIDHPGTAGTMRGKLIDGAISYALEIGKARRLALEAGKNAADKVTAAGKGKILFKGTIGKAEWESREGFTFGDIYVDGEADSEYAGHDYRIWYKNENIISWLDGQIHATVPDLICVIDDKTGEPVQNPRAEVGMDVTVFALPAPKEWTTSRGLEVFGPKHFGYDIEYKPIV